MLHKMKLNADPFERIKNGTKTIEFRLYDEKRQKVKEGDQIEFSKLPELQEKLVADVIEIYKEDTFENLFRRLGNAEEEVKKHTESMYKIYSPEKEKQYGVVGIKISLVKKLVEEKEKDDYARKQKNVYQKKYRESKEQFD